MTSLSFVQIRMAIIAAIILISVTVYLTASFGVAPLYIVGAPASSYGLGHT